LIIKDNTDVAGGETLIAKVCDKPFSFNLENILATAVIHHTIKTILG